MPANIHRGIFALNKCAGMRSGIFATNPPLSRKAADKVVLFGPLRHTHTAAVAQQGQLHASLMRSSNVTSTFSITSLSNLWHYRPELPAVSMPALRETMLSVCPYAPSSMLRVNKVLTRRHLQVSRIKQQTAAVNSCSPVGYMRGQLMKVWLEPSCSSRGRRRRCSGSRHT